MANDKQNRNKPVTLTSDGEKIDKVFQTAVKKALKRHKSAGNPIAIWRDGKVVILKADEINA
jgi:hypothetical protein